MNFEKVKALSAYEVIREERLKDLESDGCILVHKKSGARVCLISNDDDNKVFYVGFKTPAKNSTGVQHIIEHSVLCGSKKYPAKDPFVELVKGSLNTFLNAMTYPDKTVYPVASCNDKDFQNLMNVYLDAVFYPNVYTRPQIFKQEGWHYELDSREDEIKINGVVYNEMKGAYSSADDVLDRQIFNSLFPDNEYSNESGGDPDVIPSLTYEDFIGFHKEYYHPTNSYIYLYGNMDMAEKLDFIDKEYLSAYEKIDIDTEIKAQKIFDKTHFINKKYSITNEEPLEDNTFLSYNMVVDTSLNRELYVAFQILEYTLLVAPGAVLKQALLDKNIGKDIQSTYENGIFQPYFSIIAKNSNKDKLDEFLDTIKNVLIDVAKNGLDKKSLRAGINALEFRYREADFGPYPKGLMYGLQALDSWLYDDKEPFIHIEENDTFNYLKERIDTGYFEELIVKYLLDNPHSTVIVLEPERGLTAKIDSELKEKLAAYKATLSNEELDELIADTKALHDYQEEPSTKEELETIPLLEIGDIRKEVIPYEYNEEKIGDTVVLTHDIYTNGIGYLLLGFNIDDIPNDLIPYIGILRNVLGYVNTANYSYADLASEINQNSGGITSSYANYTSAVNPMEYTTYYEIKAKILYDKLPFAFNMIKEIILTSDFDDDKRLLEIINMLKSRLQMSMTSSGHSVAAARALSRCSERAAFNEQIAGLDFYRFVDKLSNDFDSLKAEFISNLKRLMKLIFREENLFVDYIAAASEYGVLKEHVSEFKKCLYKDAVEGGRKEIALNKDNEGFKTSAKVQYVAMGGNFIEHGFAYTGALRVLKVIMGYDYLWINVRVKGGAYGCMSAYSRTGDVYLTSYRDPNLSATLDVYKKASDYIRDFDPDDRDMTKYIIGTMSDMDIPLTPSAKGARAMSAYMSKDTNEMIQKERDEILSTDKHAIRALADYIDAVVKDNNICVLGGEEVVEDEKALFDKVEALF